MKKNIFINQWEKLSEAEKKIWLDKFGWSYHDKKQQTEVLKHGFQLIECQNLVMKLPDIGQMIDFLGNEWTGCYSIDVADHGYPGKIVENNELCDSLWKEVKYKLQDYD